MIPLESTIHYEQVLNNLDKRIQLFKGSSRSGKTVNVCLALLTLGLQKPLVIDITRRTLPALKATILKDFLFWIDEMGLRSRMEWNKADRTFRMNGSEWCYYSLDESDKVHGRKRDIILVNELPEVPYDIVKQLLFRTTKTFIGDYNPSILPSHYINKLAAREDAVMFHSTYKDNPYLEQSIINEIELLKQTDPWMWQVYGLGEMAIPENVIFKFKKIDSLPKDAEFLGYGFDLGYTDPSVLVAIYSWKEYLIIDEIFYERHLTDPDIVDRFNENEVSKHDYTIMDVDPALKTLLQRAGYKTQQAIKGGGSVLPGIRNLKTKKLLVTKRSFNVINDLSLYKWKEDRDGNPTDVPLHKFSHSADAIRYGVGMLTKVARYAVR